ncbi:MAG: helix-hairpin-helix domain-containing protein [Bacteroides sp.]
MEWKELFYFSRGERKSVFLLVAFVALIMVPAAWFIPGQNTSPKTDDGVAKEKALFQHSLARDKREREAANYCQRAEHRQVVLHAFDPNTTDSTGFLDLGLPPWMAKNILRYRRKGGKFRQPEDFKKIYGLGAQQYAALLPYLTIGESFSRRDTLRLYTTQHTKTDSLTFYKYPAGTIVSLNRADTTELKKIPGIGSGIARMIVGYRKQLGGFYRIEQLGELRLDVERLRPWLRIEAGETQRINLNKGSVERLKRHPYINFYQAKVIVEHREKSGDLKSLKQLSLYNEFTSEDMERLAPYVCF